MFHSESKVSTGFFRTERIPPSLWILTPLFLLLVQGYHASASDWGHVVTIICSRHLQQLLVTTDLKKRMSETQIWIGDISSPISLKTGIACLHDLTSMQEAIKQFSTKHQAGQGS